MAREGTRRSPPACGQQRGRVGVALCIGRALKGGSGWVEWVGGGCGLGGGGEEVGRHGCDLVCVVCALEGWEG